MLRFEWNIHLLNHFHFWKRFTWIQLLVQRISWFFSNQHVKLCVFKPPHIHFLQNLMVHCLQLEAKIGTAFTLDETIVVVVYLSLNLQTNTWTSLLCCLCEGWEVVISNFVLVPPEHPDEWPIGTELSLGFPAVVVYLTHGLVCNLLLDMVRDTFSEGFDQVAFALHLVIDRGFFEAVNDPFTIRWRNIYLMLFKCFNCCFSNLIQFACKCPALLLCLLHFLVVSINVLDVVVGNDRSFSGWRAKLV